MYTDDVMLTGDNVLAVLYMSKKYMISILTKRCIAFLGKNLTPDTAPLLLEQSILYDEMEMKKKALDTIKEKAPLALASEEFLGVSKETLGEILKLDLKLDREVTVFQACMKWAKNQCQKKNISPSGDNIRQLLGNNLYLIRFPKMSSLEFADTVVPENVLTDGEKIQIIRYIASGTNKSENLLFPIGSHLESDPIPKTLVIPAPYSSITYSQRRGETIATSLSCTVSKPLRLRKIYIHSVTRVPLFQNLLTVKVHQNGKRLHRYIGPHGGASPATGQLPLHRVIDVDDVRVEAGAMLLVIELILTLGSNSETTYSISQSSPNTSQLSDDYVTITFPPVDKNLLLGIEYCIP